MNNTIKNIFLVCLLALLSVATNAQEQTESLRDRISKRKQAQDTLSQPTGNSINIPKLSVRAQKFNETQTMDMSHVTWMREVYRYLDLSKGKNAALYYPVQPQGNRMNLFTMIFKLLGDGKLNAYDFTVKKELYTDEKKVKFEDVLDKLEIPFQRNGNVFTYDDFSIPNSEVLGYYIKEVWYFDQSGSAVGTRVDALCPIIVREEYLDGISMDTPVSRQPQFWIKYDDIRPYAAMMPIMTSDKNNVTDKTIDDYFRLRLYDGDIYKTTNMEDKVLLEKYDRDEAKIKLAQDTIEMELRGFEKSLWVTNDSISASKQNQKTAKSNSKQQNPAKGKKPKSSTSLTARGRK